MLEETDSGLRIRDSCRTSFANHGEQMAVKAFDDALTASRDSWTRVLCSALVAGENQPPREADFIIVNRYGPVVEVKRWIGETIFGRQKASVFAMASRARSTNPGTGHQGQLEPSLDRLAAPRESTVAHILSQLTLSLSSLDATRNSLATWTGTASCAPSMPQ